MHAWEMDIDDEALDLVDEYQKEEREDKVFSPNACLLCGRPNHGSSTGYCTQCSWGPI